MPPMRHLTLKRRETTPVRKQVELRDLAAIQRRAATLLDRAQDLWGRQILSMKVASELSPLL